MIIKDEKIITKIKDIFYDLKLVGNECKIKILSDGVEIFPDHIDLDDIALETSKYFKTDEFIDGHYSSGEKYLLTKLDNNQKLIDEVLKKIITTYYNRNNNEFDESINVNPQIAVGVLRCISEKDSEFMDIIYIIQYIHFNNNEVIDKGLTLIRNLVDYRIDKFTNTFITFLLDTIKSIRRYNNSHYMLDEIINLEKILNSQI